MSIGSQIAKRRKELKLSQEALGEKVNVSFQAVSAWERDMYTPETDKLPEIAKALSTTVSWLMDEATTVPRWEFHDEMFDLDHMYSQVRYSANALGLLETSKALILMKKYHEGQTRKGKDKVPYIAHPLLMACHALALGLKDDDLLATVLLHDVVEDCGVTADMLDVNDDIREAVQLVSFEQKKGESRHAAKLRYYENMKDNKIAAMVKLLDRCNNISHMASGFTKEKMADYIDETEEMVFPLLDHVKHTFPEYYNAVFVLKYQMLSVMEAIKRLI
ncbi:MAG: helix-turn-helix domain-containing protein [Lachnospiraceae bacterium]|nr:helix-turn-helix domain-containing protein [Candidatus Equihabitans merdae]